MKPVTFNGCFGWLHTNQESVGSDVAVLMCSGLNRDALDSHRFFCLLADEFAAAGYPTMRFDYPGTGDSCDAEDGEYWTAWQQGVNDAADWLSRSTGAQRLVLFGLRMGALLATLQAERRNDIIGLILLEPVLRGRSYMRQLFIQAELLSGVRLKPGQGLDLHELHFSEKSIALFSQVDLRQVKVRASQHIMLLAQSSSTLLAECAQAWTERGAKVTCENVDGLEPLLRPNLRLEDTPADFSRVINWMRQAVPTQAVPLPVAPIDSLANLRPPGCIETPLRFGAGERLFGILCRPRERSSCSMAVVIGNTGRDPHYGSARFAVEFARRLAHEGIASLRMDFAGLGDSVGLAGKENILSPLFEADRSPDLRDAVDVLEQMGYGTFALHGLCSGAYHVFHASLEDPRISVLLLINMPVFTWRAGDTIDFVRRKTYRPAHFLLKMASKESWLRLLQSKLDVSGAVRAQYERLHESLQQTGLRLAERIARTGPQSFPRRAMATLSRRGARTLFLFAPGDGGFDALEREFGRDGATLRTFAGASVVVVPGMDHMLSGSLLQQTVADLMIDFLGKTPVGKPMDAMTCIATAD